MTTVIQCAAMGHSVRGGGGHYTPSIFLFISSQDSCVWYRLENENLDITAMLTGRTGLYRSALKDCVELENNIRTVSFGCTVDTYTVADAQALYGHHLSIRDLYTEHNGDRVNFSLRLKLHWFDLYKKSTTNRINGVGA